MERESNTSCPTCGADLPGNLVALDMNTNSLIAGGTHIHLTPREAEVIFAIRRRAPNFLTPEEVADRVFGTEVDGINALWFLIHNIRKKIKAAGMPVEITNVRGVGYQWRDHTKRGETSGQGT